MALIEFCLRDYLHSNSAIAAIVGQDIYPVRVPRMPDGSLPNGPKITYRRKTGGRDHLLSGADGHPMPTFELLAWSRSYDSAKLLADAIRTAMDGFAGTFSTINVGVVLNTNEIDGYVPPEDASDDGWFFVMLDYHIRYSESQPAF